jgi:phage recombination protein Bet
MSEAIVATVVQQHAIAAVVPESKFELLRATLGPTLTDGQFQVFVHACNRLQLDPFLKQIHAVVRMEWNAVTKQKEPRMTIQTGIDGYRVVAERTRELDGEGDYAWCGADGVWREIWLEKEPPAAARATVYRKGRRPITMIARWDAYVQRKADGDLVNMWKVRGPEQLVKCAVALAMRAQFPHDLSGVYTDEEMAQADNDRPQLASNGNGSKAPPKAEPKALPEPRFAISFPVKQWADKPMLDAPPDALADYIAWCEGVLGDKGRVRLHKKAQEAKAQAEAVLNARVEAEMAKAQAAADDAQRKVNDETRDAIAEGLQEQLDTMHGGATDDDDIPY